MCTYVYVLCIYVYVYESGKSRGWRGQRGCVGGICKILALVTWVAWVEILAWVLWVEWVLGVLLKSNIKSFAKFTGKHLYLSLWLNKVQAEDLQIYLKRKLHHRCFLVNFAEFLRIPNYQNDCTLLLLCFLYHFSGKKLKEFSITPFLC